jgi:hypothetical protein
MEGNFWTSAGSAIFVGTVMAIYYVAMFLVVGVLGFTVALILDAIFKTSMVSKLSQFMKDRKDASVERVRNLKRDKAATEAQAAKPAAKTGKPRNRQVKTGAAPVAATA